MGFLRWLTKILFEKQPRRYKRKPFRGCEAEARLAEKFLVPGKIQVLDIGELTAKIARDMNAERVDNQLSKFP